MTTPDGQPGLNYLCPSYKRYFNHIAKYMNAMALISPRPAGIAHYGGRQRPFGYPVKL